MDDGTVKIALGAPPVEGRANSELLLWLSGQFGVSIQSVSIVSGRQSRRKLVRVMNPSALPHWFNEG